MEHHPNPATTDPAAVFTNTNWLRFVKTTTEDQLPARKFALSQRKIGAPNTLNIVIQNVTLVPMDLTSPPLLAATPTGIALDLSGVHRVFDRQPPVIENFNLRISAGEFVAILGPSGCGKSTLLRMIAHLAEPDSGHITYHPSNNFQTSYVFQDAHLLPWRTVLDNAALPLELMGVAPEQRTDKALAALQLVGLSDAQERYPAQLSGGMRMRVSLARALVTSPHLLLLDEPFAALDEITRFRLDRELRALWLARRITVIFVTHSISEAAFLANRAIVLSRKGGHIKLDRVLDLPQQRTDDLRADPRMGREMKLLLAAMEEE